MRTRYRAFLVAGVHVAVLGIALLIPALGSWADRLEFSFHDVWVTVRDELRRHGVGPSADETWPADVIVVDINGTFNCDGCTGSRRAFVDLVGKLRELGATTLAFDMLFEARGQDCATTHDIDIAHALSSQFGASHFVLAGDLRRLAPKPGVSPMETLVVPPDPFPSSADNVGIAAVRGDTAGVVRTFASKSMWRDQAPDFDAFAQRTAVLHRPRALAPSPDDLINFSASPLIIPSDRLMDGTLKPDLTGSLVVIGDTYRDELRRIPGLGAPSLNGLFIQATAIANLVQGTTIHRNRTLEFLLLAPLIVWMAFSRALPFISPARAVFYLTIAFCVWSVVAVVALTGFRVFVPGAYALCVIAPSLYVSSRFDESARQRWYSIFLSYRRRDGDQTVVNLHNAFERLGYRVFLDVRQPVAGRFKGRLLALAGDVPNLVLVVSPSVLATFVTPPKSDETDWVLEEFAEALRARRNIIPLFLPGVVVPGSRDGILAAMTAFGGVTVSHPVDYDDVARRISGDYLKTRWQLRLSAIRRRLSLRPHD